MSKKTDNCDIFQTVQEYLDKLKYFTTDNMYKFVVIVGMFIIVLSFALFYKAEAELAQTIFDGYPIQLNVIKQEPNISELANYLHKIKTDTGIDTDAYNNAVKEIEKFNELVTANNKYALQYDFLSMQFKIASVISVLGLIIGMLITIWGFNAWYNRTQAYYDLILKMIYSSLKSNKYNVR